MDILEQLRKQDRLLSESAVIKSVQKAIIEMGYEPFEEKVMGIYAAIDNTPTAFDVEKVVAELEDIKGYACMTMDCRKCKYTAMCFEGERSEHVAIDKAIDIVKRGGVE